MNFGRFEGQTFVQVEQDPEYLAWVQENEHAATRTGSAGAISATGCAKRWPTSLTRHLPKAGALVIVAHGGTQMAAMERYALPHADYYHWCAPNAGGYVLDAGDWAEQRVLHLLKTVQYTKEDAR